MNQRPKTILDARALAEIPARVLAAQLDFASAWQRVQAKAGMPGVDGVGVWRFVKSVAVYLRDIQSRLAREQYKPLPLRLAEVEKKSGGARRLLLVPTVVDRVAQSASAQWLSGRWNSAFDPSSFAYRPGVGVRDALHNLHELRDRGYRWVLDADIRSFFDSIDHALLVEKLERWLGAHSPMLAWLRQWIAATVWDGAQVTRLERGVPQGSPLSPLLANFYLDGFDRRLRAEGIHFLRYADDFLVLARTPFELTEQKQLIEKALADLRLTLSPEKTRTTTFEQCFRFLGAEIQKESILLPFEKKKTSKQPVYVAPIMPPALLNAFRLGRLQVTRPFQWSGKVPQAPAAEKTAKQRPRLHRLFGSGVGLESLRKKPV